jgi:hypothetical protein
LKVSLIQHSIVIIGEDSLNGSKTMKMPSQNRFYLGKRLGIMMKIKNCFFVKDEQYNGLLIKFLKNYLVISFFIEPCNFLRPHAIRLDQQYKEKAARQIHNTSQSSNRAKKIKVKKVLALINENSNSRFMQFR